MKLLLFLTFLPLMLFGQTDCDKAKGRFNNKYVTIDDSSKLVLHIEAWGKVSEQDLVDYYKTALPKKEFKCVAVKGHSMKHDIVFQVTRTKGKNGKVIGVYRKAFPFDVWEALIYQQ